MEKYYEDQLSLIKNPKMGFPAKVKIEHETGSTKWLSLNNESAQVLVNWLNENFEIE